MKKAGKIVGLALLASAAAVAPAAAEGAFSGTVALTSNYLFRGVTQTSDNPAIQGSFDYTNGIFYAGVWASNVDFGGDETIEADVYLGVQPTAGPISFDFGVIGYFYPGAADDGAELDYYEGMVAASINPTEAFSIGAAGYFSPEFTGETGDALYLELNASYAFSEAFSISGAFGNQDVDDLGDYDTWNLGASYAVGGFEFDLRYVDTDISGLDEEIVFTISRSL